MKRLVFLVSLLTLVSTGTVLALPEVPNVVPGKHVYTIPSNFDPPLIGKSGMREIEAAAKKLKFPYYIVLVDRIYGETDNDAAAYIDTLAEEWQKDPDFKSAKSSIFLLSYSPRKYRFLTGSYFESELGFTPGAHEPFNAIFVKYVQHSRKDPKTGIIRMMQAVDHHLAVESDPKTIAIRREAARKAEIARREAEKRAQEEAALEYARQQLQSEISALDTLLAKDEEFLPANVGDYQKVHEEALPVLESRDRTQLLNKAVVVRQSMESLQQYVDQKEAEAHARQVKKMTHFFFGGVAFLFFFLMTASRLRRYRSLKNEFTRRCAWWEEKIKNAQPRYLAFEQERDTIVGLRELSGRTREVYEKTTREVDDIFITIEAMRSHLDTCRSKAKRGSFFNVMPFERGISEIDSKFTINTGKLNTLDLFAPEMRQVTLMPEKAFSELEERFHGTIEQWERLKKAAEVRLRQAEDVFPQTRLDEMLESAGSYNIPHRWLADHPLFGDDESDRTLYTRINESRWNDPVTFLESLEELKAKEEEVADRLERLIRSIETVKAAHIESIPNLSATVLQPQDDPHLTFDSAKREEMRFSAIVAGKTEITEAEEQAEMVCNLYQKALEQVALAQEAIRTAGSTIAEADTLLRDVQSLERECQGMVEDRRPIHVSVENAESSHSSGNRYLEAGRDELGTASSMLSALRHLDALNSTHRATEHLNSARKQFAICRAHCRELDDARREYEERIANLEDRRREYASRMRRYGWSDRSLHEFVYPQTNSALDYFILLRELDSLESSWETAVREARRRYEAEERARREAEEAEERHRRSSFSSSGSSWGGSSRSSSGGSWGGGSSRSSSSGGSW